MAAGPNPPSEPSCGYHVYIRPQSRESAPATARAPIARSDWARLEKALGRAHNEPAAGLAGYGGNVIPLDRLREADASASAPAIRLAATDRPAPLRPQKQDGRRLVLIALASLLAHAALYAAANLHGAPVA